MAKPNYSFEKRQRELARKKKQDEKDANVYYFYEVYKDQAALEAHRATPHYAVWRGVADVLDGPTEPTRCQTVFPAARPYWGKA